MALHKIHECRGQLQADAQKGFALKTQAFSIIHSAVRDTTYTVIESFSSETLPDDGDALDAAVDDALERYDFEDELDDVDLTELDPDVSRPDHADDHPEAGPERNPDPTTPEATADD